MGTGYQHWLPQAYLRGFAASAETLERHDLVGKHGKETVFVARIPVLYDPPPADRSLTWHPRSTECVCGIMDHVDSELDGRMDAVNGGISALRESGRAGTAEPGSCVPIGGLRLRQGEAADALRFLFLAKLRGPYFRDMLVRHLAGVLAEGDLDREPLPPGVEEALAESIKANILRVRDSMRALRKARRFRMASNPRVAAALREEAELLALHWGHRVRREAMAAGHTVEPDLLTERDDQAPHALPPEDLLDAMAALEPPAGSLWVARSTVPLFATECPILAAGGEGGYAAAVPLASDLWLVSDEGVRDGRLAFDEREALGHLALMADARWLIAAEPLEGVGLAFSPLVRDGKEMPYDALDAGPKIARRARNVGAAERSWPASIRMVGLQGALGEPQE